ncbi:hypothetical protein ORI20_04140 [Mycobacterium sp. CVI_P3]|uniref:ABC-three component systems C-terminal domain-containing protein n=1 Tax=Mycobacterium pinniadriaticum TaxID=2994102 RepID=A0ABT3S9Q4_9MYCO|nr:ABC-three component system protein [Mycobacterium pinniadriaticum]MCX2929450.1 hypothetical protein [Mycobacterium pinniadriaticum]MCX2935874.1 hypothetical protein [Mycobacterium pinniadriaticum]
MGTQNFATGRDGGRDARFEGTAQMHPSTTAPWKGRVVVQAKHTNGFNKSFSETDFFNPGSESNTLAEEIPRIKKLRVSGELNHYILFSNRKLTANAEARIRNHISNECGIPTESIFLVGVEQLELYMKLFPEIPAIANLDPFDFPLLVSPDAISEVVEALATHSSAVAEAVRQVPEERTSYADKNERNNMTPDYGKTLRRRYLPDTAVIQEFLADPQNRSITALYESACEEFELEIVAKRSDYHTFDAVLQYLMKLLIGRDAILRSNQRLTRAIIFYMYWNCDIGGGVDVDPVQA